MQTFTFICRIESNAHLEDKNRLRSCIRVVLDNLETLPQPLLLDLRKQILSNEPPITKEDATEDHDHQITKSMAVTATSTATATAFCQQAIDRLLLVRSLPTGTSYCFCQPNIEGTTAAAITVHSSSAVGSLSATHVHPPLSPTLLPCTINITKGMFSLEKSDKSMETLVTPGALFEQKTAVNGYSSQSDGHSFQKKSQVLTIEEGGKMYRNIVNGEKKLAHFELLH